MLSLTLQITRLLRACVAPCNTAANHCPASDWAPMVMCAGMEGVKDFGGYQVALWRAIAKDLGWEETSWTFKCMDWSEMIDDLVSSNGSCSLAAAGEQDCRPCSASGAAVRPRVARG